MSYRRNDTNPPTYDRGLLSSVPDPTRAERQEGYNVDLLDEGYDRQAPSSPADQRPLTDGYSPFVVAVPHKEGQVENGTNGTRPAVANVPWYRTKWGVTAIVIAIVIIVGGIVGGVVGGTHHSHKNNSGSRSGSGSGIPNGSGSDAGNPTNTSSPHGSTSTPNSGNVSAVSQTSLSPDQPANPQQTTTTRGAGAGPGGSLGPSNPTKSPE